MTQTAYVTKILGKEKAEVLVKRTSACGGHCETCGGACSDGGNLRAVAQNRVGAEVGDVVTITSRSSGVLSAAALVYLLPLATFFFGYTVAALLNLREVYTIIAGVAGFLLGLPAVSWLSHRRSDIVIEIAERL